MHDAVLISIQPRFADRILSGEKTIEFRRRWAANNVQTLVIYSSAPVKRIVAVASIAGVEELSPGRLWQLSKRMGGGLSRMELLNYFQGLDTGYGIRLEDVQVLKTPIDPYSRLDGFRAPQSYRYLRADEQRLLLRRATRAASSVP